MAAHLFICLCLTRICDSQTLLQSWNSFTEERVGSESFILQNVDVLYVVLEFNITLRGNWTVYTKTYDKHNLGKRVVCMSD